MQKLVFKEHQSSSQQLYIDNYTKRWVDSDNNRSVSKFLASKGREQE